MQLSLILPKKWTKWYQTTVKLSLDRKERIWSMTIGHIYKTHLSKNNSRIEYAFETGLAYFGLKNHCKEHFQGNRLSIIFSNVRRILRIKTASSKINDHKRKEVLFHQDKAPALTLTIGNTIIFFPIFSLTDLITC